MPLRILLLYCLWLALDVEVVNVGCIVLDAEFLMLLHLIVEVKMSSDQSKSSSSKLILSYTFKCLHMIAIIYYVFGYIIVEYAHSKIREDIFFPFVQTVDK
jgi:hypothetical protein